MPAPEPRQRDGWYPSPREQAWDWRARRVMRYVVGPATIGWELIADKGHNLVVLLVGAMLATSTDVIGVVRALIAQGKMEEKTLDDLLREDREQESR